MVWKMPPWVHPIMEGVCEHLWGHAKCMDKAFGELDSNTDNTDSNTDSNTDNTDAIQKK